MVDCYNTPIVIVVFGRPGSGKTTVAARAVELLLHHPSSCRHHDCTLLDLDVCVPNWMRDNFANGIYPTLEQRHAFALDCCDYVLEEQKSEAAAAATIVSFSFVNTDLRETFQRRFPQTKWVLIDTTEEEAQKRIAQRKGHFYKGKANTNNNIKSTATTETTEETIVLSESSETTRAIPETNDNSSNGIVAKHYRNKEISDWEFAPVTFPHVSLDGLDPVERNAQRLVKVVQEEIVAAKNQIL